jgi:hypothetical protein
MSQCMVRFIQRFGDMVPVCKFRVEDERKAFDLICPIHICMKEFSEPKAFDLICPVLSV